MEEGKHTPTWSLLIDIDVTLFCFFSIYLSQAFFFFFFLSGRNICVFLLSLREGVFFLFKKKGRDHIILIPYYYLTSISMFGFKTLGSGEALKSTACFFLFVQVSTGHFYFNFYKPLYFFFPEIKSKPGVFFFLEMMIDDFVLKKGGWGGGRLKE